MTRVTMRSGAEWTGNRDITLRRDPRVLPVGRSLRRTKINELPQILNALRVDMSLVGWRPLVPSDLADDPPEMQRETVKIKPGVTGVGSLVFRDDEAIVSRAVQEGLYARTVYREIILPFKDELELWHQGRRSFLLDLMILLATVFLVLLPKLNPWSIPTALPLPEHPELRSHFGLLSQERESPVSG